MLVHRISCLWNKEFFGRIKSIEKLNQLLISTINLNLSRNIYLIKTKAY